MSEATQTQKYQVRLIRGYPMHVHRRAGYTFTPGPSYQDVELTEDQRKLIESDPSLEFAGEQKDQDPQTDKGSEGNHAENGTEV